MASEYVTPSLSISLDSNPLQPSLTVSGAANASNISQVVEALGLLGGDQDNCISLNLDGLESIDADAVEQFALSAGSFGGQRRRLRLASASQAVTDAFEKAMLCEVFCTKAECHLSCGQRGCDFAAEPWFVEVFSLPREMSQCREARKRVRQAAETVGLDASGTEDVILAAGEAVTNAIQHGHCETEPARFTVSCVATSDLFCVAVSDNGPGFDPDELSSPEGSVTLEHGRGILCMRALMDDVSFHFDGGTTARMVKLLR